MFSRKRGNDLTGWAAFEVHALLYVSLRSSVSFLILSRSFRPSRVTVSLDLDVDAATRLRIRERESDTTTQQRSAVAHFRQIIFELDVACGWHFVAKYVPFPCTNEIYYSLQTYRAV